MLYGRWSVSDSAVFVCICVCGQQLHVALYTVMLHGQWSVSDSAVFMCTQLLGSEIQRTAFVGLRVRRRTYTGIQTVGAIRDRLSYCLHVV